MHPPGKALDWECEDVYVRLGHHDERFDEELGYCHEIRVHDVGTMLELHDAHRAGVPSHPSFTGDVVPKHVGRMSGFTRMVLPAASLREWWEWFRGERDRAVAVVLAGVDEDAVGERLPWLLEEADAVRDSR